MSLFSLGLKTRIYGADGQAVVCPLLRGSSPTRWVAPKQHRDGLQDVASDQQTGSPQLMIDIDRDAASSKLSTTPSANRS
jgi:hypothetical protein